LLSFAGTAALLYFKGATIPIFSKIFMFKNSILENDDFVKSLLQLYLRYLMFSAIFTTCFFIAIFSIAWNRERSAHKTWPARLLAVSIAGFLAISSVSLAYVTIRGFPPYERAAYKILLTLPAKTIYTDLYTKQKLDFYFGFERSDSIITFTDIRLDKIRDSYVVYNCYRQKLGERLHDFMVRHFVTPYLYPELQPEVTKNWETVATMYNGMLVIYHVP
jgi:hypothetical protein